MLYFSINVPRECFRRVGALPQRKQGKRLRWTLLRPFSAVERGEGSPRWRFCCFRYQQRWIPRENDSKYMTDNAPNSTQYLF